MRVLFALPGLHRFERGAEIVFTSIAAELARGGDTVTLMGSGPSRAGDPYRFIHVPSIRRERWEKLPKIPMLRGETAYEEASFVPGLLARYRPSDYDITVTCSYPFTNWALRRPVRGGRPPHVFVTQNGDWPARSDSAEFRYFGCEGLVCTNPDYFEQNRARWPCTLIPNGIAIDRFTAGAGARATFGLPAGVTVVLMVSALIASKRVADGIRAVAALPNVHLVCAGDGPLRGEVDALARELLPDRFTRLTVPAAQMPDLYRSADIFLHLSTDESFGNVFVEAMACGLPVVAHDMPRIRWIVGEGEYLCDTTDQAALVAGLAAARRSADDTRPARHARAAGFAWPIVADRYRQFFADVISRHRRV